MTEAEAVGILWRYLRRGEPVRPADLLFVLGNEDLDCATLAAELWHRGVAPLIAISGATGRNTRNVFRRSEAELFADEARRCGVPEDAILLETRATNTGENVRLTRELLRAKNLSPGRILAVQKPYAERRVAVSLHHYWPGPAVSVTSRDIGFDEYAARTSGRAELIAMLVGEVHRMGVYPGRGWQAPEPVPPDAIEAMRFLAASGHDRHVIRNAPL